MRGPHAQKMHFNYESIYLFWINWINATNAVYSYFFVNIFYSIYINSPSFTPYVSLFALQEQHCCICSVCLQPQCHPAGLQRSIQVPRELTLSLAALPQPQPRFPGNNLYWFKEMEVFSILLEHICDHNGDVINRCRTD